MNIGIDITPLCTEVRTGVGEYTYELLNALFCIDKKNQYFLFYNAYKDVSKYIPNWNFSNVHFVHTRFPNKIFHLFLQILKWPKFDILIEKKTGIHLDYFFSANIGFQSISKKCKHILTLHDLSFEIFPKCFSLKMRLWHWFLSPKQQCIVADKIIVPTQNTKQDLCDIYGVSEKKIEVIPFGLNVDMFSQDLNLELQKRLEEKYKLPSRYILFFGTIEPRKNILVVVDGFVESGLAEKGYELVVVGAKGWKNKDIVRKLEQSPSIRYIGSVAVEEKAFFYKGASAFVYPSLYEGFGFPVLEAMASGIPVITSNRSSLPELAGNAAYYINPSNSSEIAVALKRFDEESHLSQFFIQKGLDRVSHFSWKKTAEQFLSLL